MIPQIKPLKPAQWPRPGWWQPMEQTRETATERGGNNNSTTRTATDTAQTTAAAAASAVAIWLPSQNETAE